jgi:hypothetical protein
MVLPQRVTADESFPFVPFALAAAATAYQLACVAESAQLALMAQRNLNDEWNEDVRMTVLLARERIYETQQSRERFRGLVREFIAPVRDATDSVSSVLQHARSMIRLLESTGAIVSDRGRLEAEVLAWATEDDESR